MGTECSNGRYVGSSSITQSGLRCVPWNRLNRTLHTVTPDRSPFKTFEYYYMESQYSQLEEVIHHQTAFCEDFNDFALVVSSVLFDRCRAGTQTKTWLSPIAGTQTHLSSLGATPALCPRPLTSARCQPVTPPPRQSLHPQPVHHHQGQIGPATRR